MHVPIEQMLIGGSLLLMLSVVASKASGRLGVPALLLFLAIGMLAGSDGIGKIYFEDVGLAQALGVVALIFILFSGGLGTHWHEVRPVLVSGIALSTIGVFITTFLVGIVTNIVLGFSLLEGLLLGAIVSSTDAAAVFAVLRAQNVNLKGRITPLIEFESGSNDPMAVFLTMALTGLLINPSSSIPTLILSFIWQMLCGAALGYALGQGMRWVINHIRLGYEGLYPVLMLGLVLFIYAFTAILGGNGFLAVYLAGIVVGNQDFVHKRSLIRFQDGTAWLMQIVMFLALGLLVYPSHMLPVIGSGLLLSAFLVFIARPVSTLITLSMSRMDARAKLMISWAGLRGAVPIILATFPLLAGLPESPLIFNLVFFIVLTSVLVQGSSIPWVAKRLGVTTTSKSNYHYPQEFIPTVNTNSQLIEVDVPPTAPAVGKTVMNLNLPAGVLVLNITRYGETIVPGGASVVRGGDKVLILANREYLDRVKAIFGSPENPESSLAPSSGGQARPNLIGSSENRD